MAFGQVGEAMAVAAVPAMGARNTDTETALILHPRTMSLPVLDLLLRPQHATNSHVQVLFLHFL